MTINDRSAVMAGFILHGWIGLVWYQIISNSNLQGVYFYVVEDGRNLSWKSWTELPVTAEVISKVKERKHRAFDEIKNKKGYNRSITSVAQGEVRTFRDRSGTKIHAETIIVPEPLVVGEESDEESLVTETEFSETYSELVNSILDG